MTDEAPRTATPHVAFYWVFGAFIFATGFAIALAHLDPESWVAPWNTRFAPPFDKSLGTAWGTWLSPFLREQRAGFLFMAIGAAIALRRPWAPHLGIIVAVVAGLALIVPTAVLMLGTFARFYSVEAPYDSLSRFMHYLVNSLERSGLRGMATILVTMICSLIPIVMLLRSTRSAFPTRHIPSNALWCIALCLIIAGTHLPDVALSAAHFFALDAYGITYSVGDTFSSLMAIDQMERLELSDKIARFIYLRYALLIVVYCGVAALAIAIGRQHRWSWFLAWGVTAAYFGTVAMQFIVHHAWTPRVKLGLPVLVLPNDQYQLLPHLAPIYYFHLNEFAANLGILIVVALVVTFQHALQHWSQVRG